MVPDGEVTEKTLDDISRSKDDDISRSRDVEAATLRTAWLRSPEHKKTIRMGWIIGFLILLLAGVGFLVGPAVAEAVNGYAIPSNQRLLYRISGVGLALYAGGLPGVFAFFFYRKAQRRAAEDRHVLAEAKVELDRVEADISDEGRTDFETLWKVTQKRLDYYHKIATTQAERSFLYGQGAAAVGFAVLIICAIIAAFARSAAASIAAGLVGVTGGGLAAYIGSTFMRSQETAADQLRAYFAQPLEFSRFLAAERLLSKLDHESRARATTIIINSIASGHGVLDSDGATKAPQTRQVSRRATKEAKTSTGPDKSS
jgi:MFS family permease